MSDLQDCYTLLCLRPAAEAEVARLEAVRRYSTPRGCGTRPADALAGLERAAPWCGTIASRRSLLKPGTYLLYRVRIVDGRNSMADECLLPIYIDHHERSPRRHQSMLQRIRSAGKACAAVLGAAVQSRLRDVDERLAPSIRASSARDEWISRSNDSPPFPVQPGLFDLRALRAADDEAARRERFRADAAGRRQLAGDAARLRLCEPELMLGLVVEP